MRPTRRGFFGGIAALIVFRRAAESFGARSLELTAPPEQVIERPACDLSAGCYKDRDGVVQHSCGFTHLPSSITTGVFQTHVYSGTVYSYLGPVPPRCITASYNPVGRSVV